MGRLALTSETLTTPSPGTLEYNGGELYFTPLGTQRGLIPNAQYYRLNSNYVGLNSTSTQPLFGVGVTLSSNTVYAFQAIYDLTKSAGTTAHTLSLLFGGTAVVGSIAYTIMRTSSTVSFLDSGTVQPFYFSQTTSAVVVTGSRTSATYYDQSVLNGTVSITTGGTFIPQYQLSAAPGGAYTTVPGSYFLIYPIGASGSNTSIGTWV